MSIVYLVLPLALLIVAAAVAAFVWATRRGQYDDLVTPAIRVLHDDDGAAPGPRDPSRPSGPAPAPPEP